MAHSVGGSRRARLREGRALENTISCASANDALRFQESATSLVGPSGRCLAHLPYGEEGVLVQAIALEEATGSLARRYAPARHLDIEAL